VEFKGHPPCILEGQAYLITLQRDTSNSCPYRLLCLQRNKHKRQLANISGFRLGRSGTLAMQENPAELETAYRRLLTLIENLNKAPCFILGVFFQDKIVSNLKESILARAF
jgi:hypothetical protein